MVAFFTLFLLGVTVGCTAVLILTRYRSVGFLRVDQSDPQDGPFLFLELDQDVQSVMSNKYIILQVKVQNYPSQK